MSALHEVIMYDGRSIEELEAYYQRQDDGLAMTRRRVRFLKQRGDERSGEKMQFPMTGELTIHRVLDGKTYREASPGNFVEVTDELPPAA